MVTREGTVTLPDGRRLAWSSAGPDDGAPVIYLHGAIGTPVRRTPALDALIDQLAIRYVAVSRPGFGPSDPCPGRTIADFPADVECLADRLGIGRFAVVGVSAGGPYAIACARALPDRAAATAAVSSLSPLCPPHAGRWMPVHLRFSLRALVRRPELAARGGTRAMRFVERRPRALARVARVGATPADRELLAAAEGGTAAIESFPWRTRARWRPRSPAAVRGSTPTTGTSSFAGGCPRCSARSSISSRRMRGPQPRSCPRRARRGSAGRCSSDGRTGR